jgi:hypothetical protein
MSRNVNMAVSTGAARRAGARGIGSAHLKLAAGFLLAFMLIDAWLLHEMLTERSRLVPSTLFAFSGPFVGAFARDWQSCCTAFSLRLCPGRAGSSS